MILVPLNVYKNSSAIYLSYKTSNCKKIYEYFISWVIGQSLISYYYPAPAGALGGQDE
jgi:hypothetical protein